MNTTPTRDGWMTPEHCRQLLAATRLSRLAFVVEGRPHIVVLNHVVDGDDIVFQTSPTTTLARLIAGTGDAGISAVVETDSASSSSHAGWSIVASGRLSRTSETDVARSPQPWRPEAVGVLLRLHVDEIHGVVVGPAD